MLSPGAGEAARRQGSPEEPQPWEQAAPASLLMLKQGCRRAPPLSVLPPSDPLLPTVGQIQQKPEGRQPG